MSRITEQIVDISIMPHAKEAALTVSLPTALAIATNRFGGIRAKNTGLSAIWVHAARLAALVGDPIRTFGQILDALAGVFCLWVSEYDKGISLFSLLVTYMDATPTKTVIQWVQSGNIVIKKEGDQDKRYACLWYLRQVDVGTHLLWERVAEAKTLINRRHLEMGHGMGPGTADVLTTGVAVLGLLLGVIYSIGGPRVVSGLIPEESDQGIIVFGDRDSYIVWLLWVVSATLLSVVSQSHREGDGGVDVIIRSSNKQRNIVLETATGIGHPTQLQTTAQIFVNETVDNNVLNIDDTLNNERGITTVRTDDQTTIVCAFRDTEFEPQEEPIHITSAPFLDKFRIIAYVTAFISVCGTAAISSAMLIAQAPVGLGCESGSVLIQIFLWIVTAIISILRRGKLCGDITSILKMDDIRMAETDKNKQRIVFCNVIGATEDHRSLENKVNSQLRNVNKSCIANNCVQHDRTGITGLDDVGWKINIWQTKHDILNKWLTFIKEWCNEKTNGIRKLQGYDLRHSIVEFTVRFISASWFLYILIMQTTSGWRSMEMCNTIFWTQEIPTLAELGGDNEWTTSVTFSWLVRVSWILAIGVPLLYILSLVIYSISCIVIKRIRTTRVDQDTGAQQPIFNQSVSDNSTSEYISQVVQVENDWIWKDCAQENSEIVAINVDIATYCKSTNSILARAERVNRAPAVVQYDF